MKKVIISFLVVFLCSFVFSDEKFDDEDDLVAAIVAKISEIEDYQCRLDEWCVNDEGKEESRLINFYFSRPRLIRIEILEGNRHGDKGAQALYLGNGKVKGHKGGMLKIFKLTLDKFNHQVASVRGIPLDHTDLVHFAEVLQFYLETGDIDLDYKDGMYVLECETDNPEKNYGCDEEIIHIDPKLLLPVYIDSFKDDKLIQRAFISNYCINSNLPQQLFNEFGYNSKALHKDGFPSLFTVEKKRQIKR